jgi:hypothetical protein
MAKTLSGSQSFLKTVGKEAALPLPSMNDKAISGNHFGEKQSLHLRLQGLYSFSHVDKVRLKIQIHIH